MKKRSYVILLLLLSILLLSHNSAAEAPAAAGSYENKAAGVKVLFPANWGVYTDENNAPEPFKEQFKSQDSPPLLLASNPNQQAFGRLIREAFAGSTIDYFDLLYAAQKNNVGIVSAKYDATQNVVQWIFTVKVEQIELTFVETIAKQEDHIIRLGFWTLTPLFEKYRTAFNEITEKTYLLKNNNGTITWELAWNDLQKHLQGRDLAYVETVKGKQLPPPLACKGEKKNVLWAVKGKKNTVYLFGSIHIGKPEFYPFEPVIESSFAGSKYLVVELDGTSKETEKKMAQFMAAAKLEKGQSLRTVLSPGVYRKLIEQLDKIGLPADTFDNVKPWVTAVALSVLKMQSMGYMPELGVDRYFLEKAKDGKRIAELESFEEQVKLFETIGEEKFLAFTLLSLDSVELQVKKLINAWRCGDLQTLEEIVFEINSGALHDVDELYNKMYFDRNRRMANKIEKYLLDDENYFIVVGSGHLIGDKGIVALLKKGGYRVTRL
jgi:uncharacterized protein YbaP (TraB family)